MNLSAAMEYPSLSLISCIGRNGVACAPVSLIHTVLHVLMECRPGPIYRRSHIAVFDRVEMNVIHMVFIVPFVTDSVFPKPLLPEGWLAASSVPKFLCETPLIMLQRREKSESVLSGLQMQ